MSNNTQSAGIDSPTDTAERTTILSIDDDPDYQELLSLYFKRENVALLQAYSGASGKRMAEEHRPDLILLDMALPDCTGYEVLQHLQLDLKTRTIPVLVLSDLPTTQRGRLHGVAGHFPKPNSTDGLSSYIEPYLAGQKSAKS